MVYFTESALAANIITLQEANELEMWIDEVVIPYQYFPFTPPPHLQELWYRVCLFRCGGSIQ